MHEFMPLELFLGFLQQTCPINYFRSKTYVLGGFAPFCCCTGPVAKISIRVHLKHEFVPPKPFLVQSQRTCSIHNFRSKNRYRGAFNARDYASRPVSCFLQQTCLIHYFRSKTQCLDGLAPFHCRTRPILKISIVVHLVHEFMPPKPFLVWSQRTCSIHNFRSKTRVYNSA